MFGNFRFNGSIRKVGKGSERTYFEYFWNVSLTDKTHSIPDAIAKRTPKRIRKMKNARRLAYFASWPQLTKDFAQLSQRN